MRQPSTAPSRARRLVGALTWVALLAGLFAMHGLGTHGAGGHQGLTHGLMPLSAAQPAAPAAIVTAHHQAVEHLTEPGGVGATSVRSTPAGSVPSSAILLTVCLAILGGLMALAATLLPKGFGRRCRSRSAGFMTAYVADRDRDPPCVVRLSVMRC